MKKALLALSFSAAASLASAEQPFSYTYIEGAYIDRSAEWELDVGESDDKVEGDGYSVTGSWQSASGVLLQAHYADGDIDKVWGVEVSDIPGGDADFERYGVLVGGTGQPNAKTSVWGGFGYDQEQVTLSVAGLGSDEVDFNNYSLVIGARYWLIDMLEINGSARLVHSRADETDVFRKYSDTDTEAAVGVRFQPFSMVSVGATYARFLDSETETVKFDARLQF